MDCLGKCVAEVHALGDRAVRDDEGAARKAAARDAHVRLAQAVVEFHIALLLLLLPAHDIARPRVERGDLEVDHADAALDLVAHREALVHHGVPVVSIHQCHQGRRTIK